MGLNVEEAGRAGELTNVSLSATRVEFHGNTSSIAMLNEVQSMTKSVTGPPDGNTGLERFSISTMHSYGSHQILSQRTIHQ